MIKSKYSQGLSLVEIMVALLISLVLMAGVLKIMSSSKRTYGLQNELAKLQDDARFIIDDLLFNLRMAGYKGCSARGPLAGSNSDIIADNESIKVVGANSNLEGDWVPSDIITLSLFDQSNVPEWSGQDSTTPNVARKYGPLRFNAANGSRILLNPNKTIPQVNSRVIISDCGGSAIYTVTAQGQQNSVPFIDIQSPCGELKEFQRPISIFIASNSQGNINALCGNNFGASSTSPYLNQVQYEVRGVKQHSEWGFALYRFDPNDPDDPNNPANPGAQPFVDGVQNMQILYGVADGSGNITYMKQPPTNQIGTPGIKSVRFGLLMRTTKKRYDIETPTEQDFKFGADFTYNPSENKTEDDQGRFAEAGHRHRFFTATVQVRNADL